jgi:5-methylcytosine-specific restriction protein A
VAWSTSNRKSRLPADWPQRCKVILKRDGYRCQHVRYDTGAKCGAYANQCDHKDQDRSWDHSYANLQSLCEHHHSVKSSSEGGNAAAKAAARRRDAKKRRHPGLLP